MFSFPAEQDIEALDSMEVPPAEDPATSMKFVYHSNAQTNSILKTIEDRCPEIAKTYSIGHSLEGRELLVIEFSNNPGHHELREWSSSEPVWVNLHPCSLSKMV